MRILIISHGHPAFHPGGGEIFAYGLYRSLRDKGADVYFLGCVFEELISGQQRDGLSLVDDDPRVTILKIPAFHLFLNSQMEREILTVHFSEYLKKLMPTVVHFHHTFLIGVEGLRVVRNMLPGSKILLTLHDFMSMCHRDGQMVRTKDMELCETSLPWRCNGCFPEISPTQFRLREVFIKNHLEMVDHFLCPSLFLLNRYAEWGLPANKLSYVANGHILTLSDSSDSEDPEQLSQNDLAFQESSKTPFRFSPGRLKLLDLFRRKHNGGSGENKSRSIFFTHSPRNRFAYFGQLTPFKGIDVLLRAVEIMTKQEANKIHLEIYGTAALQEDSFQNSLMQQIDSMAGTVIYRGPYRPENAATLMKEHDWIIVPSIWWENSPLTIEEAMIAKRPVICSNIGGMKEKVQPYRDGLHFQVGDANDLAMTMQTAMKTKSLWKKLNKKMRNACSMTDCVEIHLGLYLKG